VCGFHRKIQAGRSSLHHAHRRAACKSLNDAEPSDQTASKREEMLDFEAALQKNVNCWPPAAPHLLPPPSEVAMNQYKKKTGNPYLIPILLFFLLALFGGLMLFFSKSSIQGTEFSPNNFQTRTFSYSRIPGTKIVLSQTVLGPAASVTSTDVLKHLNTIPGAPVWHVSSLYTPPETHPSSILVEAMKQTNADRSDYWGAWSNANPSLAAVLWPFVQQLALKEFYFPIPDILEAAEDAKNPDDFEERLFEITAQATSTLCLDWKKTGDETAINELLTWLDELPMVTQQEATSERIRSLRARIRSTLTPP